MLLVFSEPTLLPTMLPALDNTICPPKLNVRNPWFLLVSKVKARPTIRPTQYEPFSTTTHLTNDSCPTIVFLEVRPPASAEIMII